jgi:hypothetical protein
MPATILTGENWLENLALAAPKSFDAEASSRL